MKTSDVMTADVLTVSPDAPIAEAVQLMLRHGISGLPVTDEKGALVGVLTEGDLLRRAELGTRRSRPRWLEFFLGSGRLAAEYTHDTGRKVHEVMTRDVHTIDEETPLINVVVAMEHNRVKRLPVLRRGRLVGIVSRANLLHALAGLLPETPPVAPQDSIIRKNLLAELRKQPWAPLAMINVVVRRGVVELWGTITDERQRQAVRVAAENTAGVKEVKDHLVWVEPMSGVFLAPEEEEATRKAASKVAAFGHDQATHL